MTSIIVWLWWVYWVTNRELICSVETIPPNYPTDAELIAACPFDVTDGMREGEIQLELHKVIREAPPGPFCVPPVVPIGDGLLETPATVDGLHTDNNLILLQERLAWFARDETVTQWQNIFDADIWNAARAAGVPAVLLKKLIGVESQFWPLWIGSSDEVGMLQVTDSGADVLMRYESETFKQYCAAAIFFKECEGGYHILSESQQRAIRDAFRADIRCLGCTVDQAVDHERGNIFVYAQVLRAYGCRNGWNWAEALRDYNGGTKYLNQFGLGD